MTMRLRRLVLRMIDDDRYRQITILKDLPGKGLIQADSSLILLCTTPITFSKPMLDPLALFSGA